MLLAWYLGTFLTADVCFLILGLVGFGSLVWFVFGVEDGCFGKQNLLEIWALWNLSCLDGVLQV